jgi:hypothetical protein
VTDVHVERARQIADALESPDREGTLHEQFYLEWKAWEAEDPTRTMADFDRAIGKDGRGNYTGRIVQTVTGATSTPWGNAPQSTRDGRTARKALREPKQRQQVIDSLTPKEKTAIARDVLKDPEVTADPKVRKAMESAEDKRAKERLAAARERQVQGRPATTLSQFFWRIIGQLLQWSRDLKEIRGELMDLSPEEREKVLERHVMLRDEAQANIDILTGTTAKDGDVIEGRVHDMRLLKPA